MRSKSDQLYYYFSKNKDAWDKKTPVHFASPLYNVDEVKKGGTSLNKIEIDDLGDVSNKRILHLQCHFGLDSISLTKMGADVLGVDFSTKAIKQARKFAKELNVSTKFLVANIYDDLDKKVKRNFDIIFCSYGCICWLPNLDKWAEVISKMMAKNSFFYIVDFHPLLHTFDCLLSDTRRCYFYTDEPFKREWHGTYADYNSNLETIEYNWNHSIAEIMRSLKNNGLKINDFQEYPYLPKEWFPNLVKGEDGLFRVKGYEDIYPLLFSIKATKI